MIDHELSKRKSMKMPPLIDNHVHIGVDPLFYLNGWSPYCLDLVRMKNEVAGSGIEHWIVFPFVAYMALDPLALRAQRIELGEVPGEAPYEFENTRLAEDLARLAASERRAFRQFLMADPARQPAEQVGVWEKLEKRHAFHGIKIQATIIQSPILSLLEQGRCMLDFAAERNLPFLIHSSIAPDDSWSQCADILRVVERRPELRFVLAHSCRFHKPSLDRVAELPNAWFDCSAHIIHCDCAVRNLPAVAVPGERFDADYTDPGSAMKALVETYPDKFIWGSDAPFYSYEDATLQMHSSYAGEVALLHALPEGLRVRAANTNTLAWLGEPLIQYETQNTP